MRLEYCYPGGGGGGRVPNLIFKFFLPFILLLFLFFLSSSLVHVRKHCKPFKLKEFAKQAQDLYIEVNNAVMRYLSLPFIQCFLKGFKKMHELFEISGCCKIVGILSNHDDDRDKKVANLHMRHWKTVALHVLPVQFSFLYIWQPFSLNLRREMTVSFLQLCGQREHFATEFGSFTSFFHRGCQAYVKMKNARSRCAEIIVFAP